MIDKWKNFESKEKSRNEVTKTLTLIEEVLIKYLKAVINTVYSIFNTKFTTID